MTIAIRRFPSRAPWGVDLSVPLLVLLAGFLSVLVLLPLGWLGW
jgi:hypothetical protein